MAENAEILDIISLFSDMYDLSKNQVKQLLKNGGLYINDIKIKQNREIYYPRDFLYNKYCLLRKGKKDYRMLEIKI